MPTIYRSKPGDIPHRSEGDTFVVVRAPEYAQPRNPLHDPGSAAALWMGDTLDHVEFARPARAGASLGDRLAPGSTARRPGRAE
ncbi:hypothetical protein GCM10027445_17040 [Amycolatopsis endophytica]|uniref:Uncharacterized protein n=1 Tax=Amycolatopsis endophytica TaxID=860233 RepID=A0A853B4F9_9PSEU|nr:hypothetical protein [Amycolatopsis endophytica]NYI90083.1 hypothetical protein [Amycolatopsis endophytica]